MRNLSIPVVRLTAAVCCVALVGCGGSGPGSGAEQTLSFGSLTTRIAGTVQPPVTSGEAGVVVTGVAGGNITALTLQDTSPTLVETRIAYTSSRDANREVYVMNADGTNQTNLTNNAALDYLPAWSMDGSKIAFTSTRDGNDEVFVMNADGSNQTNLTNDAGDDGEAAWSPDGTKIAFSTYRDSNYEVYVMNPDGTNLANLTNNAANDFEPAWSPDGSKITFTSDRDGDYNIYFMYADGTSQTRVTTNAATDDRPSWSPDGTKIAFTSTRDGNSEVYVMNADGTGQMRLTNNAVVDYDPAWSPDGSKITFSSYRDSDYEVYVMNADGTGQVRLTTAPSLDFEPAWGPFTQTRTLVGSGGSMGTNAAGFLFGQSHKEVRSLVAFDALNRSSARVKAQTGLGGGLPNVVFSVSADSITRLSYTNITDVVPTVVKVVGTGASILTATDAIVSFDSADGLVSAVLPYTSNRSGAPTFSLENGTRVIRGSFLGAWDGKGVNRAPNGASEVRLDARTGAIVSIK